MEKQVVKVDAMKVNLDDKGRPVVPISKAVRAGDFLFISGMPPQDPETGRMIEGDIRAQTRRVLENLKLVLEAAGSAPDKVVKTTVYCTNAAHFTAVNDIYREYFPEDPPARTFVTVGSWPHAFDIEIECVAIG